MTWNFTAGLVELLGNLALVVALVTVGSRPWPYHALKRLAAVTALYASTNVFYAVAYLGRITNSWEIWDTAVESVVLNVQVFSMWAMLIFGIESVVAANE